MPYKTKEARRAYERTRTNHLAERVLRSKCWREKRYGVKYPTSTNCQMCGKEICGSDIELDHDHKTGLFRGWLCTYCNVSLGMYEKIAPLARRYLQE